MSNHPMQDRTYPDSSEHMEGLLRWAEARHTPPRYRTHPWDCGDSFVVVDHGDAAEPIVAEFDTLWHPDAKGAAEREASWLNADPFGGPETEHDRIRAQHEPRQLGGGPQLVCSMCDTSWPCAAVGRLWENRIPTTHYDGDACGDVHDMREGDTHVDQWRCDVCDRQTPNIYPAGRRWICRRCSHGGTP